MQITVQFKEAAPLHTRTVSTVITQQRSAIMEVSIVISQQRERSAIMEGSIVISQQRQWSAIMEEGSIVITASSGEWSAIWRGSGQI